MKKLRILFLLLLTVALTMTSCAGLNLGGNGNGNGNSGNEDQYTTVTIAEAKAACAAEGISLSDFYVAAKVASVDNLKTGDLTLTDDTDTIAVSGICQIVDGEEVGYTDMAKKPVEGNEVLIKLNLIREGDEVSAWKGVIINIFEGDNPYKDMSIEAIRALEKGEKVMTDGVVARITYANGLIPSGFILVDETASIYVYDGAAAESVKIGNKVTLTGEKDYWILEDEQTNAAKFEYKGSCQISGVTIVANDGKVNEFDKSVAVETTVKEILETPVNEDITSKLYKVTALVEKNVGTGFVNYYFHDLDYTTSTYTYTQCSGSDFTWLDQYDGKICTVYITPLNAKSTSSDCYFRFLPVEVIDEGFVFNTDNAPKFAVDYYGLAQLLKSYSGDPAVELITSVSSELLGFENVVLSYSSSDESVIKINVVDGKTILNCPGVGTATVTVTATYGDKTYSATTEITVTENTEVEHIGVDDAITSPVGEQVTVKGIVGPSFVHSNRKGFYLIDKDAVIAVSFANVNDLADIVIGNTVIVTGTRALVKETQIAIDDAALVSNYYGNSAIPADRVIKDLTLAEIASKNDTTALYEVKVTVNFESTQYSKNCYIKSGETSAQLYSSNAEANYSFLLPYNGKEVTLIVSTCNWNGKAFKLCAVALYDESGNIVYNEYSFPTN